MAEKFKQIDSVPICPERACANISRQIDELCHRMEWPPTQPLLVIDPATGKPCYCFCA